MSYRPKGLKYNIKKVNKGWIKKGSLPWNDGLTKKNNVKLREISEKSKGKHTSPATEFKKGHKPSLETREKQRQKALEQFKDGFPEETKEKQRQTMLKRKQELGYINSPEAREKGRLSKLGKNNPMYVDGRTPINKRIYTSYKFKQWRDTIFKRDNYTCQKCGHRGGAIHPHHCLIPFSKIINCLKQWVGIDNLYDAALKFSPLWDTENGQTLCVSCHKEFHKKYGYKF